MRVEPLVSRRVATGVVLLSVILIFGFGLCLRRPPIADEALHIEQIRMLLRRSFYRKELRHITPVMGGNLIGLLTLFIVGTASMMRARRRPPSPVARP